MPLPEAIIMPATYMAIDPISTALVVVDMQYFDAARDAGEGQTARDLGVEHYFDDYFGQIDAITPRIARLLDAFRCKKVEVAHLRVAEVTRDSRDVGLKQLVRGLIVPIDSKEAEFLPGLDPAGDEIVINKSASGVFPATNFDRLLRNIGIRTLVFTGTSTSGCIQSAIYDALDLGYGVFLVADACADATSESQLAAVASFAGTGVHVTTTAALLDLAGSWPVTDASARSGLERVKPYLPRHSFLPNDQGADAVNPYTLIFGPAVRLRVTRENAALVLVDAQHFTCDTGSGLAQALVGDENYAGFFARVPAALASMRTLLEAARKLNYTIVHVRTAAHLADARDLSPKLRRLGLRPVAGTTEAAFMPEVAPVAGEAVLTKPGSGIFTGTGLDELLRNIGAETLVLCGISIEGALESSIRSAGDRGYGTLLIPEACAGSQVAEQTLRSAERGIINVMSVAEAVASLTEGAR